MKPLFYIHQASCISPQQSFGDTDLETLHNPADKKMLALEPSYEGIPPGVLRRMGKAVRMGVGAALPLLKNRSDINGFIIGTANGGMEDCIKFLNQIIQYEEGQLTPGNFVQSTPNAIAAQLGMISKNRSYNITHVHRGLSFENAVIDAALQLATHPDHTYILGAVDEISAYNYNIEFLGDWYKDEDIQAAGLYSIHTKGAIAGEGAAMFVVNNRPANALARIEAVQQLHNDRVPAFRAMLEQFLAAHLPAGENIDLLLSGENGDIRYTDHYAACEAAMDPSVAVARFKHMTGEYTTVTAPALWLALQLLQKQALPAHLLKRKGSGNTIRNILVYNNYKAEQHSLILLKTMA